MNQERKVAVFEKKEEMNAGKEGRTSLLDHSNDIIEPLLMN